MKHGHLKISIFIFLLFLSISGVYGQAWKRLARKKEPTFFDMQKAANTFYDSLRTRKKPGYKQFKRWEWFARSRLTRDGFLDPGLNWKGWEEKQTRFGSTADTSGSDWKSLGPHKVPTRVGSNGGMGRLNCIEFDPRDANTIWVGAPTGGLWKSVNGGETWNTKTDKLPNMGVSDIEINPRDPNIMYIATGDKQRGSALSIGIMKSLDGGETWRFTGMNPETTQKYKIGKLLMHPDDPETLLAASNMGIFKTTDGGNTWEKKIAGDFFDMEIHPANSDTWYATGSGVGVFRSSNSGENWAQLKTGLPDAGPGIGRIAIATCSSSPSTLYALYCRDIESEGWIWGLYGIYRSKNGGETWTLQANSPNLLGWSLTGDDAGGQGGYALVLHVNPADPNMVFAASVNMWRSNDGGVTWRLIANNVHVDHHDFAYLPQSSSTVFSCNDGGLHKSEDNGNTWKNLSNGLVIQQIYRLAISTQNPNHMVVGSQDNGSEVLNGIFSGWGAVYGGDGTDCLIDPNNNDILYCASQFGHFGRSTDGGRNFERIFTNITDNAAWLAPLTFDPEDSSTIYTATNRVYKSTDRGTTRSTISDTFPGDPIRELVVAPSDPKCIIISNGTFIYRTVNGGTDWTQLDTSSFPSFITGISIHPRNKEILWVTFGGYGRWNSKFTWNNIPYIVDREKVLYSENGGSTWLDVSDNLPNIPVNCIEIDVSSWDVYIGTDLGVFYSSTGRRNWKRFDNGLPNVIITDLEIQKTARKIVAATYGRGLWESPLAKTSSTSNVYPPIQFAGTTRINRSLSMKEYMNVLTWKSNPANSNNNVAVSGYRIYEIKGEVRYLLAEPDMDTYQYVHRQLEKKTYKYELTTMSNQGEESQSLTLSVRIED